MLCKLKGCRKCNGDLVLDGEEWRCWQCGVYYYPKPPAREAPPDPVQNNRSLLTIGQTMADKLRRRTRSARDINSVISANARSEDRWWRRNKDVISYLDEGRTVREISLLIGRGPRQIRVIREQLHDMRSREVEGSAAS